MSVFTINNTVIVALLQVGVILFGIMFAGLGGKFHGKNIGSSGRLWIY